jgi:hypothetical protein
MIPGFEQDFLLAGEIATTFETPQAMRDLKAPIPGQDALHLEDSTHRDEDEYGKQSRKRKRSVLLPDAAQSNEGSSTTPAEGSKDEIRPTGIPSPSSATRKRVKHQSSGQIAPAPTEKTASIAKTQKPPLRRKKEHKASGLVTVPTLQKHPD